MVYDICDPYASDANTSGLEAFIHFFPERLVELLTSYQQLEMRSSCIVSYLWKAIGMTTYYGNVSRLRMFVVQGCILLDGDIEIILLGVCCRVWVFANV